MKVDRVTVWYANDAGYCYVDEDGNYWSRVFMDELEQPDLWFPVELGPDLPHDDHPLLNDNETF